MKKSFAVIISLLLLSTVFLSGCVSTGGDGDFEIWVNEEPFEYEGSMCDILYVFTTDGVGLELWADAGGEYFFEYSEFIWEDDGTTRTLTFIDELDEDGNPEVWEYQHSGDTLTDGGIVLVKADEIPAGLIGDWFSPATEEYYAENDADIKYTFYEQRIGFESWADIGAGNYADEEYGIVWGALGESVYIIFIDTTYPYAQELTFDGSLIRAGVEFVKA